MTGQDESRVDWSITGYRGPGGRFGVIATTDVIDGRLEHRAEIDHMWQGNSPFRGTRVVNNEYDITVTAREIVQIEGPSYEDCLAALFKQWAPKERSTKPLPGRPVRELGSGPSSEH